jgi:hypothetical protein
MCGTPVRVSHGDMSQTPTSYEPYSPGRPGPEKPWRPSDAVPPEERAVVRRDETSALWCGYGAPHGMVVASVVCVVIWAMSGFGYFWPIWVLLPALLMSRFPKKLKAAAGVSGHLRRQDRN